MVKPPPSMAKRGVKASKTGWMLDESPTRIATTSPAPVLIPRIPESARGLRVKVCRSKPAKAKEAPPIMEAKIRGKRIRPIMSRVDESACPLIRSSSSEKEELA